MPAKYGDTMVGLRRNVPGGVWLAFSTLLLLPLSLWAAPPQAIYRSVGPGSTTALANGKENSLSIAEGKATFDLALPDAMGVGDAIVYDNDMAICFVQGRIDSKHFSVQDPDGKTPKAVANDKTWSVFRAYTSLDNALRARKNEAIPAKARSFDPWKDGKDISAKGSNQIWNIACYCDGGIPDTTPVVINAESYKGGSTPWQEDETCFLNIFTPCLPSEVGQTQRHNGKWDPTKYRLEVENADAAITGGIWTKALRITGLQVAIKAVKPDTKVVAALKLFDSQKPADLRVSHCIIRGDQAKPSPYYTGIWVGPGPANVRIWNNIIYGFGTQGKAFMHIGIAMNFDAMSYVYNNTVSNCGVGIAKLYKPTTGKSLLKNNLCYNNTANYAEHHEDVFDPKGTNNLSGPSLSDAPGLDPLNATKVEFMDAANGDFSLAPTDTGARGKGVDLSKDPKLAFEDDIAGRPRSGAWDVGACAAAAGAATSKDGASAGR